MAGSGPEDVSLPLAGCTVGITAERRAGDFIEALQRKGARVHHAPTITIVPLVDDDQLYAATERVIARPVDIAVITTGQGFRGWVDAAAQWGLADDLLGRFAASRVVVRGPKATGAVRAAGLIEHWCSPQETNADVVAYLLDVGVAGARIALQLHGAPLPHVVEALTGGGAEVVQAQPYRWKQPADVAEVFALIDAVIDGGVDVLTFTSAPAATNLLNLVREHGRYNELLDALRTRVRSACVGPVTAAPLVEHGIPVLMPERQRLGALVKLIAATMSSADRNP